MTDSGTRQSVWRNDLDCVVTGEKQPWSDCSCITCESNNLPEHSTGDAQLAEESVAQVGKRSGRCSREREDVEEFEAQC